MGLGLAFGTIGRGLAGGLTAWEAAGLGGAAPSHA
ncbi:unnamed protein product, partial [marine sediment metagenome]